MTVTCSAILAYAMGFILVRDEDLSELFGTGYVEPVAHLINLGIVRKSSVRFFGKPYYKIVQMDRWR